MPMVRRGSRRRGGAAMRVPSGPSRRRRAETHGDRSRRRTRRWVGGGRRGRAWAGGVGAPTGRGRTAAARAGPRAARWRIDRGVGPPVGRMAGGAEQERRPEGEHVGGRPHQLAPRLLRGHELGRADHGTGDGEPAGGVADRGDPEVGEERAAGLVEQHVGGLDVAVDDPVPVGLGQGPEQGVGQDVDLAGGEGSVMGHLLAQGAAGEVGQDEDDVVAVVDDVEQGDDVRVAEARQSGGFSSDPVAGTMHLVGAAVQQQTLAGHQLSVSIDRQVDDAHPTAPEPALHLVLHGPVSLRAGRTAADPAVPGDRSSGNDVLETHLSHRCPYHASHREAADRTRWNDRCALGRCAPDVCERPTTGPRQETP